MERRWRRNALASDPDVVLRRPFAAFVARIQYASGFDQQQFHFLLGAGFVLDPFRYDVHFTGIHQHVTIAKVDAQLAVQDDERLVGVEVVMPDEVPSSFTTLNW